MSSTLHVASHQNPYVAECLRLGILAARQRPPNEDEWDTRTIEEVCIPLMVELGESSSGGTSYVEIPKSQFIHQYEDADADQNFCRHCQKLQNQHEFNHMTETFWGYP